MEVDEYGEKLPISLTIKVCKRCFQVHMAFILEGKSPFLISCNEDQLYEIMRILFQAREVLIELKADIEREQADAIAQVKSLLGIKNRESFDI